jgi:hypothetical protein
VEDAVRLAGIQVLPMGSQVSDRCQIQARVELQKKLGLETYPDQHLVHIGALGGHHAIN